ncbi:MAG: hypothetical protein ACLQUS_14785 [Desulfobaccales bacterium]
MQDLLFEDHGITGLKVINGGGKLKPKGDNIKPQFDCCSCCGRLLSELTPFANGALLRGKYRRRAPYNKVFNRIFDEFFSNCSTDRQIQKAKGKLIKKYGKERAVQIINWVDLTFKLKWCPECRDCVCLDDYESDERFLDGWNPPERCYCCGRHRGELKPFTEGDRVVSFFHGKPLARRYRPDAPPTEGVTKVMDEFFGKCITYEDQQKAKVKLIQKYGEEEAENLWTHAFFLNDWDDLFKDSWECRDCIGLDMHQYLEKKMVQKSDSGNDSTG